MPDNDWKPGARYAQNSPRGPRGLRSVLVNGQWLTPTPGQAARLAVAEAQAEAAIHRVQELDPSWRPQASAYESVDGLIRAREGAAREAEARITELGRLGIGPGPFAAEWIPARGPGRELTAAEREELNRIGDRYGCDTCGTLSPGTKNRNWVGDHQDPNAINAPGRPQRRYPHCMRCSLRQGGFLRHRKLDR